MTGAAMPTWTPWGSKSRVSSLDGAHQTTQQGPARARGATWLAPRGRTVLRLCPSARPCTAAPALPLPCLVMATRSTPFLMDSSGLGAHLYCECTACVHDYVLFRVRDMMHARSIQSFVVQPQTLASFAHNALVYAAVTSPSPCTSSALVRSVHAAAQCTPVFPGSRRAALIHRLQPQLYSLSASAVVNPEALLKHDPEALCTS